jgi:predicted AAA+ superfamily ATPase
VKRDLRVYFEKWKNDPDRKPILLKGARQVGKSYLARDIGGDFKSFVEINFEFKPELGATFDKDLDPRRIIRELSLVIDKDIIPGETLLFLDEIQECPRAITALRYFYEKMPHLHVIAAGSLIEFALEETGLPVGRVMPFYLYPLSFMEFLSASGNQRLRNEIENHEADEELPGALHNKLLGLIGEYMAVGGMPAAVKKWIETGDLKACMNIHQFLINTYRQDFAKYARKRKQQYVEMVFNAIPRLLGKKFIFSAVSQEVRARELRPALELLAKAGLAHIVYHSSSNGLPLGAEVNPAISKIIFLDTALSQTVMGMDYGQWILDPVQAIVNQGAITEAFVGQELLAYGSPIRKGELYYWMREKKGGLAEVDYVWGIAGKVIPIEVKSGLTGSLKSIQIFLEKKTASPYGLVFSQRNYFKDKNRRLIRYPLYAIAKAARSSE